MATIPVYLLSYPRSGSTLTRTYFSVLQGRPQLSQYQADVIVGEAGPLTTELDGLSLVKSHHFSEFHRPAIYLVRDGRNAMLSNLFLKFLSGGHCLCRPDEIAAGLRMLSDEGEFWGDHVAEAMRLAGDGEVCFIRYEDLVHDPVTALDAMITFMNRNVPAEVLRECVSAVARSRRYFDQPLSGHATKAPAGSAYEQIQSLPGPDRWRTVFDGEARDYFHGRGGTAGLLRFGYERSPAWWQDAT